MCRIYKCITQCHVDYTYNTPVLQERKTCLACVLHVLQMYLLDYNTTKTPYICYTYVVHVIHIRNIS